MAKIKQAKNGTYWFQYYAGKDLNGKSRVGTRRGFKTRTDALQAQKRVEYERSIDNQIPSLSQVTFNHVYRQWWNDFYVHQVRESTQVKTNGIFKNHILPTFGKLRIRNITIDLVQTTVNQWSTTTQFAYTRWYHLLVSVLTFAHQRGYSSQIVTQSVILPRRQEVPGAEHENYWTIPQVKDFLTCLEKLKDKYKYTLFWLYLYTGARRGEVLALKWQDIDFNGSTVKINKTITRGNKGQTVQSTKTRSGKRTVSLDKQTLTILSDWQASQRRLLGKSFKNDHQLIFPNTHNHMLMLNLPLLWLKKIIADNHLHSITLHGLRHTCITTMYSNGVSIKEIQKRVGDADVNTILNTYIHVSQEQDQQTADTIAEAFK